MEDSRQRELALLYLLVPIWLIGFGLFVQEGLRGGRLETIVVVGPPADSSDYPVVARHRPGALAIASPLDRGDRLIRVGDADLRGAMPWRAYAEFFAAASKSESFEVEAERSGRRSIQTVSLQRDRGALRDAAIALSFAVTAVLLVVRAPRSRMTRSFALATLTWTLTWLQFQGAHVEQTYAFFAIRAVAGCVWAPLMIRAAFHFPEYAWPTERRIPVWPWVFLFLGLTWTSKWAGLPFSTEFGTRANPAVGSLAIFAVLAVATRNYRRADALGKRQVRWVMWGVYIGLTPVLIGNFAAVLQPELAGLWYATQSSLIIIPIAIFIAVSRSNLLDIDRVISGTASYTLLLVVLGAGALLLVPWVAEAASQRAGMEPKIVQAAVALLVAGVSVWLEPLVRPFVERAFFSERQDLQTGVDQLVIDLSRAANTSALAQMVGERLNRLLRPASCVIYARSEQAFAPVFATGSAVTPVFDLRSPLMRVLGERTSAIDLDKRNALDERVSASNRAALGSLGAAVLLPISREDDLAGFIVLGRKRSGDIYTSTDLALFGWVGTTISAMLARKDGEELLEAAQALQERLKQYVPTSIAKQLVEGRSLEDGEREVSVLFADLRGYTSLSEGRRAGEIFGLVSRYTETVSRIVTAHGGTVVEFNGDGMMAVFGAPENLAEKERRALSTAREVVEEVRALGRELEAGQLEVGVGIATGLAYVGAIRSVDRYIWSAIGNTTNLAARLQSLTRELGASVVVDAATGEAAGEDARGFLLHRELRIRGLLEPCDVYSLALDASGTKREAEDRASGRGRLEDSPRTR